MNPYPLRLHLAVVGIAAALLMAACGDDSSMPPPTDGPDTTPPQPIRDLDLAYDSVNGAVRFSWSAPRDDDFHPRADHYDMRYGGSFPFDWNDATPLDEAPAPLDPGAAQEFVLATPSRGTDLYASIRAVDAAGNVAPAGSVAHVRVPGYVFEATCVDALTGLPVAGIDALITTRASDHLATGADGRIVLADLAGGSAHIALATGSASVPYHAFSDAFTLDHDISLVIPMIAFQQPVSPLYSSILALLQGATPFSTDGEHVIKRFHSYPVPFYARDFVNGSGLDYHALLLQAADRWNARVGVQMFAVTSADPAIGILVEFLPRSEMGTTNGITEPSLDTDGYPVHDSIRIVDDFADGSRLYSIFMHELGHTIPLLHLPAGFIMYGSQPLPSDISDDEVTMVKLLLALPNGTVLDRYDATPPAP